MTKGALTQEILDTLRTDFANNAQGQLMQNALANTPLDKVAQNRAVVANMDRSMSHKLDKWPVANQKRSGRCWLFSGLNLLRAPLFKQLNVEKFEFSQTYLFYWDKLEKANWFFENMIRMADRDVDDRTVAHLLSDPIGDGGQWNMFVALVEKYGIVPQWAMPEAESSTCSGPLDEQLERYLREGAFKLRQAVAAGAGVEELKSELVAGVHRILNVHLGTPPESFIWQYNDQDNKFTREGRMTPQEFAKRYITRDLKDFVCLVNDPRPNSPYGKTFTVDCLGNVVGGDPVRYLNVPIEVMKACAQAEITSGHPVWFGCDTGQQSDRDLSIWDKDLYNYGAVYGVNFGMDKATRLLYKESLMTHAMLFTGVDVLDGQPRRWRVENSWGEEGKADEGFYTMNDSWFDEYVFEIAVPKSVLPAEYQAALEQEPLVLPAWDPMGSLAK